MVSATNKRIGDGSNVRLEGARREPSANFELPTGAPAPVQPAAEASSNSGGLQTLGQKLGELRRGKGMTQIAVASKMGTTQPSLARLEKNELNPNLKTLSRYASAIDLDVKVSYIQGKDEKAGVAGVSDLEGVPVKLAELRKESGMTQSAVADRMNITQPVIARLESGEIAPNLRTLERYAEAMDMRIELAFDDMKKAN